MARRPPKLTLEYTAQALADLDEVWDWNAEHHGVDHADRYVAFLKQRTGKLLDSQNPGRPVPTRTGYRFEVFRRRRRGQGHLVVFQIVGPILQVLRFYHTAQDWQHRSAQDQK